MIRNNAGRARRATSPRSPVSATHALLVVRGRSSTGQTRYSRLTGLTSAPCGPSPRTNQAKSGDQ